MSAAISRLLILFIPVRQSELHTEGDLDVTVLLLVVVTIKYLGHAHRVASLNKCVLGEVVGATQTQAKVNVLGIVLDVNSLVNVFDGIFAIYIDTQLRTKVDAECGGNIVLEHHGNIDVVGIVRNSLGNVETKEVQIEGLELATL